MMYMDKVDKAWMLEKGGWLVRRVRLGGWVCRGGEGRGERGRERREGRGGGFDGLDRSRGKEKELR